MGLDFLDRRRVQVGMVMSEEERQVTGNKTRSVGADLNVQKSKLECIVQRVNGTRCEKVENG